MLSPDWLIYYHKVQFPCVENGQWTKSIKTMGKIHLVNPFCQRGYSRQRDPTKAWPYVHSVIRLTVAPHSSSLATTLHSDTRCPFYRRAIFTTSHSKNYLTYCHDYFRTLRSYNNDNVCKRTYISNKFYMVKLIN